jgi:hypothetical protein
VFAWAVTVSNRRPLGCKSRSAADYRQGGPGCHSQLPSHPFDTGNFIEESIMEAMRFFRRNGSTPAQAVSFPRPSVGAGLGTKVHPRRESDEHLEYHSVSRPSLEPKDGDQPSKEHGE